MSYLDGIPTSAPVVHDNPAYMEPELCCSAIAEEQAKIMGREERELSGTELRIVYRTIPGIVGLESPDIPQQEDKMS